MSDFASRRTMMVDTQVRPSDVTKFPIIDAMLSVPRESFVPVALQQMAYLGENIDLGDGRVLFEPRTFAKMLDGLAIGTDELVLDVGCALGYSSAVIARMAEAVVAVESDDAMAAEAQDAFVDQGVDNVIVHQGPLGNGAAAHGPYDVIIVQGGVSHLPDTLVDQLKEGGRMGCLFMVGALGEVRIGHKRNGRMSWRMDFNASAPVLDGFKPETVFQL